MSISWSKVSGTLAATGGRVFAHHLRDGNIVRPSPGVSGRVKVFAGTRPGHVRLVARQDGVQSGQDLIWRPGMPAVIGLSGRDGSWGGAATVEARELMR